MRLTRRAAATLAFAASAPATLGRAQPAAGWSPTQPVRVIIPFTPGGTMDPVARIAQAALQQDLGQPVVIEHKPGGSTVIGTQEMARLRQRLLAPNACAASTRLSNSAVCIACSPASAQIVCTVSHVHAAWSLQGRQPFCRHFATGDVSGEVLSVSRRRASGDTVGAGTGLVQTQGSASPHLLKARLDLAALQQLAVVRPVALVVHVHPPHRPRRHAQLPRDALDPHLRHQHACTTHASLSAQI